MPSDRRVVVTLDASQELRAAIGQTLDPGANVTFLRDVEESGRDAVLGSADALISWSLGRELNENELAELTSVGLIQLLSAGVDGVPFDRIPAGVPVASNAGAYSDPIAEHVLALSLALAKRLPQTEEAMRRGEFDQTPTRELRGAAVGILGFGGIGEASARLFDAFGARVHAIDRSGRTDEPVEWIGTLAELERVLADSDVLVVTLPLTRETHGLIGARELSLMKPDAILVLVSRAAIVDEDALYEHLRSTPSFSAGIDVWWQEPRGDEPFASRLPFLELPNVIGSPHNSGITAGSLTAAVRHAAANVSRFLRGEPVQHLVDRGEYPAEASRR